MGGFYVELKQSKMEKIGYDGRVRIRWCRWKMHDTRGKRRMSTRRDTIVDTVRMIHYR